MEARRAVDPIGFGDCIGSPRDAAVAGSAVVVTQPIAAR